MTSAIKIMLILVFLSAFAVPSIAVPNLGNVSINPASSYLGEAITFSFDCFSSNSPSQNAHVLITGPNVIIPNIQITQGPPYTLTLDQAYIDRTGGFVATAFCSDADGEINLSKQFFVSQVTGQITDIKPAKIYTGDMMDIVFDLRKDTIPLSAGVNFSLYIDDQPKAIKSVIYDTVKGWIIRTDAPTSAAKYNVKIVAALDRTSVSSEKSVDVSNIFDFSITSIDKTSVMAGDNVTITLAAAERGNFIDAANNLKIDLDGYNVPVNEISNDGKNNFAEITIPGITPRSYTLQVRMDYKNYTYLSSRKIDYIVPISGQLVDKNKAVNAQIKFIRGSVEKYKFYTDASGSYSGNIVPDNYDVDVVYPESVLHLKNIDIKEFSNPLSYSYMTDVKIPGIKGNLVYLYQASLPFSKATIEIPYLESDVDESNLKVFKCTSWSSQKKECSVSWIETNSIIDKTKNVVRIDTDSLGVFAVGSREEVVVNFNLDKKVYNLRDVIKIKGTTQDSAKNSIPNAVISISVGNNMIGNLTSDNNGIFSIEFLSPTLEGDYALTISAEKQPYLRGKKSDQFSVERVRSLSILFPDSVRVEKGKNTTKEIVVINTGQDDMNDLKITIDGIPDYYKLEKDTLNVPVNSQDSAKIFLFAPADAETNTFAGSIKVSSEKIEKEKSFGFTIIDQISEETKKPNTITGLAPSIQLPAIDPMYVYILIFAAVAFSSAFVLKKHRRHSDTSMHVKGYYDIATLSSIKNQVKSKPVQKNESGNGEKS